MRPYPKPGDVLVYPSCDGGTFVYLVLGRSRSKSQLSETYEWDGCVDVRCLVSGADHTESGEVVRLQWAPNWHNIDSGLARRHDVLVVRGKDLKR